MRGRHLLLALVALVALTLWLGALTYYAITSAETALAQSGGAKGASTAAAVLPSSGATALGEQAPDLSAQVRLLQLQVETLKRRNARDSGAVSGADDRNSAVARQPSGGAANDADMTNGGSAQAGGGDAKQRPIGPHSVASEHEAALLRRIAALNEQLRNHKGRSTEVEARLNKTLLELEICQKAAKFRAQQHSARDPNRNKEEEGPSAEKHPATRPLRSAGPSGPLHGGAPRIDRTTAPGSNAPSRPSPARQSILNRRKHVAKREPDPDDEMPGGGADTFAGDNGPEEAYPTDPPEPPSMGIDESVLAERGYEIPVVIFAYNRADVLRKCIATVLKRMPPKGFRLFVSQDGRQFPQVTNVIDSFASQGLLTHLIHRRNDSGANEFERRNHWQPYFAIAHHYEFVLNEIFKNARFDRVILLEEDLEVGIDFFDYMAATSPLFDADPTLYCVSAWNDNGKAQLIADVTQLYRSDFFPGLGWMMSRKVWEGLRERWPRGFWDDWMRQPDKREGRSCIRPEVPRSFTWCSEEGVSQGQFCAEHLEEIKLVDKKVEWATQNVTFLVKGAYDQWLDGILQRALVARSPEEVARLRGNQEVKIFYRTKQQFKQLAHSFELMDDFKDNVPRTAYRGVVTFRYLHHRVHLVSEEEMYD